MYVCNESTQDAGPLALLIKLIVNSIIITLDPLIFDFVQLHSWKTTKHKTEY